MRAAEAIEVVDGRATLKKGKLSMSLLADVTELMRREGVRKAEIWINASGAISFSAEIPSSLHQRLRNILASR